MAIVNQIQSIFSNDERCDFVRTALESQGYVSISGVSGSAGAFLISALQNHLKKKFLCVFESEMGAKTFFEDLCEVFGPENTVYYPALGNKLWSDLGPSRTEVGQRIFAIGALVKQAVIFFITTASAIIEKIADPEDVELYTLSLQVGQTISFDLLIKQLAEMGFTREVRVDVPGEMSIRGGIVDVFLFEEEYPFRIEFWGDKIESIRKFDIESQKSIEPCNSIEVLPLGCAGPYGMLEARTTTDLDLNKTIFDYLNDEFILWLDNKVLIKAAVKNYENQANVHFQSIADKPGFTHFVCSDYYCEHEILDRYIEKRAFIDIVPFTQDKDSPIYLGTVENGQYGGILKLFRQTIENINSTKKTPLISLLCDSEGQRDRIVDLFAEEGFPQNIHLFTLNLSSGFTWPEKSVYIFTTRELYSRVRRHKPDRIEKRSVSFHEELSIKRGDYVVHNDYGIGLFEGLEKIKAYGKVRECLTLAYQDGDRLYVPLDKMDQVQKYSSSEGMTPVLNKLGAPDWDKLKQRTKKRMREITEDLIKLYATRKMRPGFTFSDDTVWQKELEASFQFEETIDQLSAIADVKKDMQTAMPMDRLICGDVGYGKTEVAVRAAFKAISDGKQVAVLVPTTILAEQHFTTFSQRLSQFPIQINVISRFKTPKQQRSILEKLENGDLDLVIGTHRLLSKDVRFKELGLLIVDEEQRFGVIHKEKLKLIKQTVDTLTLSATPIPRTMHLALMGAKDMSIINSPPQNRLPIKTEVSRFDEKLVREVILRELDRKGQVFFVHNRIQSIHGISALLNKIVPEARVAVAHGQMKGHELEKVMLKFIQGDVQVLVCTMIIESGIDMPNANTLIINRADKMGLAQLYQLRGRVGRSNQQAFAYLLIPSMRKLTHDAIKRLQTIQEYSELGSGYKIAMRDLEIRGAGNVFGAEQTGFVNALGYELYTKIIQETIAEIKRELNVAAQEIEKDDGFEAKVEFVADAYLPEDYIVSQAERVDIYRRLARAKKAEAVNEISKELRDRFGIIPKCVLNLIDYILIKIYATASRLERLSIRKGIVEGDFNYHLIPQREGFKPWLEKIVEHAPDRFELKQGEGKLGFIMNLPGNETILNVVKKFLISIS